MNPPTPREKLHAKLRDAASQRQRKIRPPARPATTVTTPERLRLFPTWLLERLVQQFGEVVHNEHSFILLFHFDMTGDPLTTDPTAYVGSRLDVLLIKINGGIYYETSTHMDGLQSRILAANRSLQVTPGQLLYVARPVDHVENATVDVATNVEKLMYVACDIPAALVRNKDTTWSVPLTPAHLPTIRVESSMSEEKTVSEE